MELDRRRLLKGLGFVLVGGAGPLLAACGDGGADTAGNVESATTAAGAAPAAGASTETTAAGLKPIERLRLAGGQFGYPTPFLYSRAPGLVQTFMLFDTLLWKDGSGEVIGWLAEKWDMSADGLTWTFKLHPDARWHDGTPLTSEDVAFTFDYLLTGPAKAAPSGIVGKPDVVSATTAVDATTVVFTLKQPSATFAVTVAGKVPIMPKHIWSTVAEPDKYRAPESLIGSGPYKVDAVDDTAGTYRYVANEAYHLGTPVVRSIEFVPVPDELLALSQGGIDAASPPSEEGLPEGALAEFENDDFTIIRQDSEYARVLQFNLTKGFPYDNADFRRAVAYAVDRKDLVKRILLGSGAPGSVGGIPPSSPWLAPDLPSYDLDVAKAKSLLDSIGLRDVNGDGVRERPDGQPFTMVVQVSARDKAQTGELVKQYLKAVGIDVSLNSLDGAAADQAAARGAYDTALIGYSLSSDPDALRLRLSAAVKSTSFSRIQGYNNPEFEAAAIAQSTALDEAARRVPVEKMQQIVAKDVPAIPLYHAISAYVFRNERFDAFYFTPGSVWGSYPGPLNKHVFVTGRHEGF